MRQCGDGAASKEREDPACSPLLPCGRQPKFWDRVPISGDSLRCRRTERHVSHFVDGAAVPDATLLSSPRQRYIVCTKTTGKQKHRPILVQCIGVPLCLGGQRSATSRFGIRHYHSAQWRSQWQLPDGIIPQHFLRQL